MSKTFSDEQFEVLSSGLAIMRAGLDKISGITFDPEPAPQPNRDEEQAAWGTATDTELGNMAVGGESKRPIPWGKQCAALHPDFLDGLLWIEEKIELRPEILIPCMKFESNINPKARNPKSTASGLIQFMGFTAKNLGTTIEKIRSLDAMGQLTYVYKYFANMRDDWSSMTTADVYMAILWPKAMGKPDDYKVWAAGTDEYKVNAGLDINRDGMVTKREAASKVLKLEAEGYEPENVLYI